MHRVQGIAFSSYLIETAEALFLIDSGFRWFEPLVLRKARAIGRDIAQLRLAVLTHPHLDHVGAIGALGKHADFEIAAHPGAREALARGGKAFSPSRLAWTRSVEWLAIAALPLLRLPAISPTLEPADGERLDRFGLPGTIFHTPGHSDWCISLVLDDGTAFAGDLIIGAGHMTSVVAPPAMAVDTSRAFASMRRLLEAGARVFKPAHGREFTSDDVAAVLRRAESGPPAAGAATAG